MSRRVELRWKEEVLYWEDPRGFAFDAGWGSTPPTLYVPTDDLWRRVMPEWLRDRREVVLERLRTGTDHVLQEVDTGYDDVSGRLLGGT